MQTQRSSLGGIVFYLLYIFTRRVHQSVFFIIPQTHHTVFFIITQTHLTCLMAVNHWGLCRGFQPRPEGPLPLVRARALLQNMMPRLATHAPYWVRVLRFYNTRTVLSESTVVLQHTHRIEWEYYGSTTHAPYWARVLRFYNSWTEEGIPVVH